MASNKTHNKSRSIGANPISLHRLVQLSEEFQQELLKPFTRAGKAVLQVE